MAWTHNNNNSSTSSTTVTLAATTGDLMTVFISYVSGTITSVADADANAYTKQFSFTSAGICTLECWSRVATATKTASIVVVGLTPDAMHASNYSNNSGTIPGTVNTTNSALAATVNLTTTGGSDKLILGFAHTTGSIGPGTGFTTIASTLNLLRILSEYQTSLTNSAGTNTVAVTFGSSDIITAIAFEPPPAAAGAYRSYQIRQAVNRASTY